MNELIGFTFSPLRVGKYIVVNELPDQPDLELSVGFFSKWTNDIDIPLANYKADMSKLSEFKITSIDTINKIAEGTFELHFIISERYAERAKNFADQITFRQGRFRARFAP